MQAFSSIAEFTLLALQMKLQGRLGDIDTGLDDCILILHTFDHVLTQPYLYELTGWAAAPATVRVRSIGVRGSGWATDWPKAVQGLHELAHAADCPLRKGAGLIFLPAQEKQEIERSAVTK